MGVKSNQVQWLLKCGSKRRIRVGFILRLWLSEPIHTDIQLPVVGIQVARLKQCGSEFEHSALMKTTQIRDKDGSELRCSRREEGDRILHGLEF